MTLKTALLKTLLRPKKSRPVALVVGLGNPGPSYARHRHNVGFMAVDVMQALCKAPDWRQKFNGLVTQADVESVGRCLFLKPQTYMNRSGQSVQQACQFYKIPPESVYVIHDELDIDFGRLKIKQGGGSGGHNGIKSIDAAIGPNYHRLRLGIGHPGHRDQVHDYVLGDFPRAEQDQLGPWLERLAAALPHILAGEYSKAIAEVGVAGC